MAEERRGRQTGAVRSGKTVGASAAAADGANGRLPAASPPPPLRPWSRVWRYLVAVGIGLAVWTAVLVTYGGQDPDSFSDREAAVIRGFLTLDLVLGVAAVATVPLRRRHPVITAVITVGFTTVSSFATGAATLAIVSMSTRRRWRPVVAIGALWVGCTLLYEMALRPSVPGTTSDVAFTWASGGLAAAVWAVSASTGFYIGARRELLVSLRERAENAEREQTLREESARESERTRIAREMHDVLAHRISLVSLHAGALSYRTDLTREETAVAATVIQNNAQSALTELRQVLGIMRSSDDGHVGAGDAGLPASRAATETGDDPGASRIARPEPPQPTLSELPALIADSRSVGMDVSLTASGLEGRHASATELVLDGLSESVSRAAYRIAQEALTNARKHAPGSPVTVTLERRDDQLQIVLRNPRRQESPSPRGAAADAVTLPGSGVGLLGLRERAELAGGFLAHGIDRGDRFVVTARLPWK